jgi:hypothetical protein
MNQIIVFFSDDSEEVYHVAIGNKMIDVIREIEMETGKLILNYEWLVPKGVH